MTSTVCTNSTCCHRRDSVPAKAHYVLETNDSLHFRDRYYIHQTITISQPQLTSQLDGFKQNHVNSHQICRHPPLACLPQIPICEGYGKHGQALRASETEQVTVLYEDSGDVEFINVMSCIRFYLSFSPFVVFLM
jgi:hypothetical protein